MENVKHMKDVMDFFIKSLPDFIEKSKKEGSFIISHKQDIVFYGNITPSIMEEWCKIVSERTIPFKLGDIRDYHNDMYLAWVTRRGYIYLTAKYTPYIDSDPLELTWGIFEIEEDDDDEI